MAPSGGLAALQQSHKLQTYDLGQTDQFVGGQRNRLINIESGQRIFAMLFIFSATLVLAGGPATKILNGGKLRSVFQYFGMVEASDPVWYGDSRAMGRISDLASAGTVPNTDLVALANGTYHLRDTAVIYAAWPWSSNPQETAWREKNTLQQTSVYGTPWASLGNNAAAFNVAGILVNTPGTALMSSLTMKAIQYSDDQTNILSFYRPRYRTWTFNVNGTMNNLQILWNQNVAVRHALFAQDSQAGWVTDPTTQFQLVYSGGQIIGVQGPIDLDALVDRMYMQYGSAVDATAILNIITAANGNSGNWTPAQGPSATNYHDLSNYFLDFQQHGKLSQILRPELIGANLRYQLTGPGVSALANSGQIQIATTLCELEDANNDGNLSAILNPVKPWQRINAARVAATRRS